MANTCAAAPDAWALTQQVARGETTARGAVISALARIAADDPELHAFCAVRTEEAVLADADAVDKAIAQGDPVGPLAGVPVAVKDLICTHDLPTTFGSPLYEDFRSGEDDVSVARLRKAGALVLGKTNCSEFGYGPVGHNPLFPTTRNPWNTDLTPGGSSAGSAAAVASGLVPLALGSDGGGSIRIPAALTGTVGFKASWGRVPLWPECRDERYPGASGWEALEHAAPLTRTVRDAALAMSVLAGPSPFDPHSLPNEPLDWTDLPFTQARPHRVALCLDDGAPIDPEIADLCESAARGFCASLGATMFAAAPETGSIQNVFETIVAMETDRNGLRNMARQTGHRFRGSLASLLERRWTADDFTDAIFGRKRIVNATAHFMTRFDLYLTPTVAAPAFPADDHAPERIAGKLVSKTAWTRFSALANLTGCPAISVPVGFTANGLPIALQIMGRHLDDPSVICAAFALEELIGCEHEKP